MEKNMYTKIWKGIAIAICIISVSVLAISLVAGFVLMHACEGDISAAFGNTKYEDSKALLDSLEYAAWSDVGDYLGQQEYLETNGTFDAAKYVDVMEFSDEEYQRSSDAKALEYRVGELKNWSASNEFQQIRDYYGDVFYNFYYTDFYETDEYEYYDEATDEYTDNAVTEQSEDTSRYTRDGSLILPNGQVFREQYTPKGFDSLQDYSEENNIPIEVCYEALYNTLAKFQLTLSLYEDSLIRLDPANTNLRYIAKAEDSGEVVSTNIPRGEECRKSASSVTDIGSYEVETYVNADYPVQDAYWTNSNSYGRLASRAGLILTGLLAGLIGAVASVIYLSIAAGRGKEEGIALSWIDRPILEVAILIWGFIGTFAVLAVILAGEWYAKALLHPDNYQNVTIVLSTLLLLIMTAAGTALFLTGYLSLVRRIKAKTLWKNSLCCRLVHMMKTVIRGAKVSAKVLILFGIYFLIMLVCVGIGGGFGILLAWIVSIAAAWFIVKDALARQKIMDGLEKISGGQLEYKINLDDMDALHLDMAEQINQVGTGLETAVEQSLKNERMKTDLITNVSHDIKTPLTSIINYVDLLKRENIQNEKARGYIDILDQKSQRLKHLTEDLVEASKISSGNVTLEMVRMDFNEILQQALGEFEERFRGRGLKPVVKQSETPLTIQADGRRIWRILENLFQNVVKYAMPDTRVYVEAARRGRDMVLTVKNISENPLNIEAEELTERFIRGDVSRSTEGSGLGLSIAKNLTTLQNGKFDIYLDGDLFKVTVTFGLID